ncbi:uncharacterized protein [Palaemon carinicauda]|uniref:uncharacterized protein n=1 Tax=Palaemon carinicauda TaxID=392227 RepID=UPI0035B6A62C
MPVEIVPIILGTPGMIPRSLKRIQEELEAEEAPGLLQKSVILGTAHIIRKRVFPGTCKDEDKDDVDEATCSPYEADTCFNDVNENLLCHVLSTRGRNCTQRTARDFCNGLDDALNCTADIIDTDCSEEEGRVRFDNWLQGLRGAYGRLCLRGDYELLNNLLTSTNCWNFKTFVKCVEKKANLTHIADLLTTELDQTECNLLQMAVSICNEKAEKGRVKCRGKGDAVNEAVAAFFSSSSCAGKAPTICNVLQPNEIKSIPVTASSSSSPIPVILTLFVTLVIVVLVSLVLVWRKVITVNARCSVMRRASDGDEAEVSREDYGRFL